MLAIHMNKALIDVDQSKEKTWFISPSNVECTIALMESRHGLSNSTMASPHRANHGGRAWPKSSLRQLEYLRRPAASSRCFSFVSATLWWMDGCGGQRSQRQYIEEHVGQRAGGANRAQNRPGVLRLHDSVSGPFGVMLIMCLDLCRALWSSLEVLDELILKVSSLTLFSYVNNKLQNRHARVNLIPPGA
jgi:hypothetical protein